MDGTRGPTGVWARADAPAAAPGRALDALAAGLGGAPAALVTLLAAPEADLAAAGAAAARRFPGAAVIGCTTVGEIAAQGYAEGRIIAIAHPVVVRIGGRHHVRSIRAVAGEDLVSYSAIDKGLVLTLARPQDMAAQLAGELAALGDPAGIIACDCILRRMEAEETQQIGAVSAILSRYRVAGFSTYGEQLNAMHVNQTMTGVALYPPP
jgi:hypothetical protein